jgi:hypothetical protein
VIYDKSRFIITGQIRRVGFFKETIVSRQYELLSVYGQYGPVVADFRDYIVISVGPHAAFQTDRLNDIAAIGGYEFINAGRRVRGLVAPGKMRQPIFPAVFFKSDRFAFKIPVGCFLQNNAFAVYDQLGPIIADAGDNIIIDACHMQWLGIRRGRKKYRND